ncbi:416_t:CDS:1 [Acaulospora morrowiae]|uniref:416_t:CDS:1 n=1 Tax=Acaulospora morrowiae TaxID=94023 RepID=A0A9N8W1G0_9GLOM|nr:416_t:CDS:1 [Acaulospora morrowiae]
MNSPSDFISVKMPFPPTINHIEFMKWKKSPNAYIIYHNVYVKQLKKQKGRVKRQIVASLAGHAWKSEPDDVRARYEQIAREIKKERAEKFLASCIQHYVPPNRPYPEPDSFGDSSISSPPYEDYEEVFDKYIIYED